LLKEIPQSNPQVGRVLSGKASDNQSANQGSGALAFKGLNHVAHELQPFVEIGAGVQECCDGGAIRKQGFS
jgi:hypothetical protein